MLISKNIGKMQDIFLSQFFLFRELRKELSPLRHEDTKKEKNFIIEIPAKNMRE
jgi:hypothetical protein